MKPEWEDIDQFFSSGAEGGFAERVRIETPGHPASYVNLIYDDGVMDAFLGEVELEARKPRMMGNSSLMRGIVKGSVLTIVRHGVSCEQFVSQGWPKPDGTGTSVVFLELPGDAV